MKLPLGALAALALIPILSSCIGVASDVEIRSDGSGTVALEYRISRLVETMGKLDGNERWLPLPVGRADMDRTVARIPGLTLTSFSQTGNEVDVIVKADLAFADSVALTRFLDASGRAAVLTDTGGRRTLTLRLVEGGGPLDPDLERLVDAVFMGYLIDLRFRFPSVPTVAGGGSVESASRSAVFSSPVAELLSSESPRIWSVSW